MWHFFSLDNLFFSVTFLLCTVYVLLKMNVSHHTQKTVLGILDWNILHENMFYQPNKEDRMYSNRQQHIRNYTCKYQTTISLISILDCFPLFFFSFPNNKSMSTKLWTIYSTFYLDAQWTFGQRSNVSIFDTLSKIGWNMSRT